jgi:hypothetical protein
LICAMRRRVRQTVGEIRLCTRRLKHAWTHPFSTRSWDRCMKPDTRRRIERTWGWGMWSRKANTYLYERRRRAGPGKDANRYCRADGHSRASRKTGAHGHAMRVTGRYGSQSSRRSRVRGAKELCGPTCETVNPINDDGLCKGRSGSRMAGNAGIAGKASRGSAASGSRQQLDSPCTFLPRAGLIESNR